MTKVSQVIEALRKEANNSPANAHAIRPLIAAVKKVYESTSDSKDWLDDAIDEMSLEQRLRAFSDVVRDEFDNPRTGITYRARARRAWKLYREFQQDQIRIRKENNELKSGFKEMVELYKTMLTSQLRKELASTDGIINMEFFPFPVSSDGIGAIIVPKGIRGNDLDAGIRFLKFYAEALKSRKESPYD